MQTVEFLDVETVEAVHEVVLNRHGGGAAGVFKDKLESAVNSVKQAACYINLTVFQAAAMYGVRLIESHSFVDGNKRTGMAVMLAFLDAHGYTFNESQKTIENLAVEIAEHKVSQEYVANWLKDKSTPSPP